MATSASFADSVGTRATRGGKAQHSVLVRITHWITTLAFVALLLTGIEIVISHPRFYWGETGNVLSRPLFIIPIPSSRATVPTGFRYVMPDQNGWSRYLHFEAAWLLVLTGALYVSWGVLSGHFRRNLLPWPSELSWQAVVLTVGRHIRIVRSSTMATYNVVQRITYLSIIFLFFPLIIWTGLAMSPAIASAFPILVRTLGGQQSARTIHFFDTLLLVGFVFVHTAMICIAGFCKRMMAMTTGRTR
jgi:thiosulfate reductase cytochrome b subunit